MTETEVPGPEPDWQPAMQPPYSTGKDQAHQYSLWQHSASLFEMIGALAMPVHPVAQRLGLEIERSWDGLDGLDVALFRLHGFSFAISKHDAHPFGYSYVWLTQPHKEADTALDTLLEVVGMGEDAVALRGDADDYRAERIATSKDAGSSVEAPDVTLPISLWARFRRALGTSSAAQ
ncbi:hypothetical protein [Streptomyces xanthophaeus]